MKIASVDLLRRVETLAIPCGRCDDLYVIARLAVLTLLNVVDPAGILVYGYGEQERSFKE